MLIENEATVVDAAGTPYVRMVSGTFVRGMGGFGGEKQPKQPTYDPPNRPADLIAESATLPQQAMLYRLSGYTGAPAPEGGGGRSARPTPAGSPTPPGVATAQRVLPSCGRSVGVRGLLGLCCLQQHGSCG